MNKSDKRMPGKGQNYTRNISGVLTSNSRKKTLINVPIRKMPTLNINQLDENISSSECLL